MSFDIRWLAPAAIVTAASPPCFAVQYVTDGIKRLLVFCQVALR